MSEAPESQDGGGPVIEMMGVRIDNAFVAKGQAYDGLLVEYQRLLCMVARMLRGEFPASAMTVDLGRMSWQVTLPLPVVEKAESGAA